MLLIKISANEQRQIERAITAADLGGVRGMILDKLAISKTMQEFGRAPTLRTEKYLPWSKALRVVEEVLGKEHVTRPPFPNNDWYARINGVLRRECMTEDTVRELAEYARDHLRRPVSFDFLICQQHRIRTGEFDVIQRPKDIVPEMPLLPDADEENTSHDWRNET